MIDTRILCIVLGEKLRPHKAVRGHYDGKPRRSCIYCGQWLDKVEGVSAWWGWLEIPLAS